MTIKRHENKKRDRGDDIGNMTLTPTIRLTMTMTLDGCDKGINKLDDDYDNVVVVGFYGEIDESLEKRKKEKERERTRDIW